MYMLDSNSPINLMCLEAFAQRVRGKKTERIMDAGSLKGEFESKLLILISLLHYSLILSTLYYIVCRIILNVWSVQLPTGENDFNNIIHIHHTIVYISYHVPRYKVQIRQLHHSHPQCTKYSEPDSLASACVVLNV